MLCKRVVTKARGIIAHHSNYTHIAHHTHGILAHHSNYTRIALHTRGITDSTHTTLCAPHTRHYSESLKLHTHSASHTLHIAHDTQHTSCIKVHHTQHTRGITHSALYCSTSHTSVSVHTIVNYLYRIRSRAFLINKLHNSKIVRQHKLF